MISVVVPFYNIPDSYFIPFINSIKQQTYKDYEVLIVNDGSTEVTSEHIREIIGDDSRFKILDKPHGGLSDTRNYGILNCRGTLLWIIDPDDVLYSPEAFLKISEEFKIRSGLDLLIFGYLKNSKLKEQKKFSIISPVLLSGKQVLSLLCMNEKHIEGYTWNKVLNLEKISKTIIGEFDVSLSSFEDKVWLFPLLTKIGECRVIPDILYQYNYNPNSLSHSVDKEKLLQRYDRAFEAYCRLVEYSRDVFGYESAEYYSVLADAYGIAVNNIVQMKFAMKNTKQNHELISKYSSFIRFTWRSAGLRKYKYLVRKILKQGN